MAGFRKTCIGTNEQETVIRMDRATGLTTIYTTDTRHMNKLDKIYERTREEREDGKIYALGFTVPNESISFRRVARTRRLTSEQKKDFVKRMKTAKNDSP
jgi:hypothetical protein